MRRLLASSLALALAIAPAPLPPKPAQAQWAVVCTNCATWTSQLLQLRKEVEGVAETITMRIAQAQMLKNQITNMASLPGGMWQQIEGNFNATQSLFQRGQSLAASASMVSGQLQSYRAMLGQTIDMPRQYATWSQQANDSVANTLAGMGLMRDQMASDRVIVNQIRARSSGARGAVQAIQANTEMASAQVNELHRLRELMIADATLNANAFALRAQRQAAEEAANEQFFSSAPQPERGNRRF